MTARVRVPHRIRTEIECAIARGWRIERICDRLDVPPETVHVVWDDMDAAVADDPDGPAAGSVASEACELWLRIATRRARRAA